MTFKVIDSKVRSAIVETRNMRGGKVFTAIRLIKESSGWRVDSADHVVGGWMPWTSVTPESFRTVGEAKAAAKAWWLSQQSNAVAA